jgi:hypothetical protein
LKNIQTGEATVSDINFFNTKIVKNLGCEEITTLDPTQTIFVAATNAKAKLIHYRALKTL